MRMILGLVFMGLIAIPTPIASAAPPARRILYNFDGDSCLFTRANSKGPVAIGVDDLKKLVEEVTAEASRVDTILVCVNAQVMYYPTRVGTMRGANSTPEERAKWPATENQRSANIRKFFDAGIDPYAVMLAEARKRGREALISFRMNDAHGNDFLRTAFWAEHPEFRLPKGALDFGRAEVRDHVFRLIEEAVTRYDSDGIELDFNRFPTLFREMDGTTEERVAKIDGLVERVRAMLDRLGRERGRKLVLSARTPSNYGRKSPTPETCRAIGCDPAAWAKKGWIDFVTVSEFLFTRYDLPIRPWKDLIREVPIFGGIECAEGGRRDQVLTADKYRREALRLKRDGADGIYLFNFFTTREHGPDSFEPPFEVLKDLGEARVTVGTGVPPQPGVGVADLVFSARRWEGDYRTSDIPGGVANTPVIGAIYTIRDDGSELRKVAELGRSTDYPKYSPDGRFLYFQSNHEGKSIVYRCRPDSTDLQAVGIADRLGPEWKDAYGYSISGDGKRISFVVNDHSTGRIALANADGSSPRLAAPKLGYLYMHALSPSSEDLVAAGPASGYRLRLIHLADGSARDLTPDHPDSYAPMFTPDGKTIVFLRIDGDLYRVDRDGKNLRRLTEGNNYVTFRLSADDQHGSTDGPDLSPDGTRIAYIAMKEGVPNAWTMNLDGSSPRQITHRNTPCGRVRFSPDGKRLAFVSFVEERPQLFVVDADGGEPQQLTRIDAAVYFIQWNPQAGPSRQ